MKRRADPISIDPRHAAETMHGKSGVGQIVLVLQGGGALGAYQAGVYQALHEQGVEPDWVIGTSIGAINAALIAGNAAEHRIERLQEFWSRMQRIPIGPWAAVRPDISNLVDAWRTMADAIPGFGDFWSAMQRDPVASWTPFAPAVANLLDICRTMAGGIPGFFHPNFPAFLSPHLSLGSEAAGFYSTAELDATLSELVDFSRIPANAPRLTVGAANVRTSQMRYFDSTYCKITKKHVMASGALPPAFPAVFIDGEGYWDGGILSNTPIEAVFDDKPRRDSLIFSTHVWNARGAEPDSIWEVFHRHKNVQYASRTESHVMRQQQIHRLRHVINLLAAEVPEARRTNPEVRELVAYGCPTRMHVLQLQAPELDGENHYKDIDFTPGGIRFRWEAGHRHACRVLEQSPWRGEWDPLEGLILHDAVVDDILPSGGAERAPAQRTRPHATDRREAGPALAAE